MHECTRILGSTRSGGSRHEQTSTCTRTHARTHARMQTFICKARGCKLDRSSCSSVCRSRISCSFIESLQPATVQFRATAAQLSSRAGGSPCGWAHLISKALSRFFCSCFSCDDFFCAAYKARNFFSASSAVTWRERVVPRARLGHLYVCWGSSCSRRQCVKRASWCQCVRRASWCLPNLRDWEFHGGGKKISPPGCAIECIDHRVFGRNNRIRLFRGCI